MRCNRVTHFLGDFLNLRPSNERMGEKLRMSPGWRVLNRADPWSSLSVPKIAKMARVAAPLIHYYFGSKENLWRESVANSLGDLRREALAIRNATRALAPLDRLRVFLQTLTQHAARWPDNFVMIIAEARSESDRFAWVDENYTGVILFRSSFGCLVFR